MSRPTRSGMIHRQLHRYPAAEAEAEYVRPVDREVVKQGGDVTGEVAEVDVTVDVRRAAMPLQFGGDYLPVGGQVGQQPAE